MTRRRRLAVAAAGAGAVLLLSHPAASAVDVWGNVGPASQLPSGALMDAYPLGNYYLDHHFSAVEAGVLSGVDVSGIAPTVAWLLATLIWQLTALLANAVITLFAFAFSLDLVNGSDATGGAGALAPVSEAVRSIYRDVFGGPWLTVAVVLAGMWSMWNALVRRRYTETASALGLSLLYIVIALAFVTQPERTIGSASHWTNEVSTAFLSLSSNGTVSDQQKAKQDSSDHLFELLVYRPWVVLQFGGLEHCVRDDRDVPVRPLSSDPRRDAQLARRLTTTPEIEADGDTTCINNRLKYAPHFLRFAPGSEERNKEYEALKDGDRDKLPDEDPGKEDGSYRLSDVDKPAAEAMGKSGQYQRLGLAVVIFAGELGAFLLLGSLAVAVILAQVLVLLLLAFAPVALVVGTFPGRGHQFFLDWLTRLVAFLLRKAFYALVLAVLLAVSTALQDATANLGWLMAWGLQAVFYWAVYLNRKQLTGKLSTAVTGTTGQRDEARMLAGVGAAYAITRMARRTFGTISRTASRGTPAGAARAGRRPHPLPEPPPPSPRPHPLSDDGAPAAPTDRASASRPSRHEREHEHEPDAAETNTPGDGTGPATPDRTEPAPSPTPAASGPSHPAHPETPAVADRPDDDAAASATPGDRADVSPGRDPSRPTAPIPRSARASTRLREAGRGAETPKTTPPQPARSAQPTPPQPATSAQPTTRPVMPHETPSSQTAGERPAPTKDSASGARASPAQSSLSAELRADAARMHRDAEHLHQDAQRVHRNVEQLGDGASRTPPSPAPPAPRPPSKPERGGETR